MRTLIAALFLCVSLATSSTLLARADTQPIPLPTASTPLNVGARALQIGDSITVRCESQIQRYDIRTNGYVGRQFYMGVGVALSMYGEIPSSVIIELGTNGRPGEQSIYAMMDALKQARHVFFVTVREPRPWQALTNKDLVFATRHWSRVHLIRWHGYSYGHPGWLEGGVHPTLIGCRKLALLEDLTLRHYGL